MFGLFKNRVISTVYCDRLLRCTLVNSSEIRATLLNSIETRTLIPNPTTIHTLPNLIFTILIPNLSSLVFYLYGRNPNTDETRANVAISNWAPGRLMHRFPTAEAAFLKIKNLTILIY